MNELEIYSEIVSWAVLVFIFMRVFNTQCFQNTDWIMTLISVSFSYFVRYISKVKED
jgi:hypothetical protein